LPAERRKWPSLAARAAANAQLLAYIVQISHRVALLRPETLLRATPTIALPVFKAGSVPSTHSTALKIQWRAPIDVQRKTPNGRHYVN
jgi:hypothetical protein